MAVGTLYAEFSPTGSELGARAASASSASSVIQSIGASFYGVTVLLAIQCVMALCNERNEQGAPFKRILVYYVALLCSVNTAFFALCQERIRLELTTSGVGDGMQVHAAVTSTYDYMNPIAGPLCGVLVIWISDALLMYRCYQFYDRNLKTLIGPIIMFCVSIVSAALLIGPFILTPDTKPEANLSFPSPIGLGTLGPYLPSVINSTFSMALNALLTAMIVKRLLRHNKELRALYNEHVIANEIPYLSIKAMVVESSGLVIIASLGYIILQFIFTQVNLYFIVVYSQATATYLLILRVAKRYTNPSLTHSYTRSGVAGGSLGFEILSVSVPLPVTAYSRSSRTSRASLSLPMGLDSEIRTRRSTWPLVAVG